MNEVLFVADVLSALCLLAFIWAIRMDRAAFWPIGFLCSAAMLNAIALCGLDAWARLSLLMGAHI